jgi:hypothetical protein
VSSLTSPIAAQHPSPDPCPEEVRALELRLSDYLAPELVAKVRRAYEIGAAAHAGQLRKSGEAYITHPVAVAGILADLRLDAETLCAAILHDALEDTPLPRSAIVEEFGEPVAELVDGVTKLDKIHFRDRQEADAESFRKMMLAMSRDLRVILIKLADRLHNMRTLDAMAPASRRRIARETLEIYAPIAHRLGMNRFKAELQDLGFRALHPLRHQVVAKRIASQPVMRREAMATLEARISARLAQEGLPFRLVGRVKAPWSIYQKMLQEVKSFDQVMDVFGFRIVVPRLMQCYVALGALPRLHRDPEGEWLPEPAHRAVRQLRHAHRSADPHRGNGRDRRARHRRALAVQDRGAGHQQCAGARAGLGAQPDGQPGNRRQFARVPGERQGRPVPRRGLPVHPARRHPVAAAQRHRARLRLRRAHRRRQPRGRRARGQEAGAAAQQAGQRANG